MPDTAEELLATFGEHSLSAYADALLAEFAEEFHGGNSHNQKSHAGGPRSATGKLIPPPPGRAGSAPRRVLQVPKRPSGVLPDVPFSDVKIAYRPRHPDGKADPGEIVWAKIPFEEDPTRSKDRPVLIIGRTKDGKNLVGVQLTSKAKSGRPSVGKGDWDKQGRESYLNTDRFVQVDDKNYRREGAFMKKPVFQGVVDDLAKQQGAAKVELALQTAEAMLADFSEQFHPKHTTGTSQKVHGGGGAGRKIPDIGGPTLSGVTDSSLKRAYDAYGMNGKPTQVNSGDFQEMTQDPDYIHIGRGVWTGGDDSYANTYHDSDEHHVGIGVFGNGTYFVNMNDNDVVNQQRYDGYALNTVKEYSKNGQLPFNPENGVVIQAVVKRSDLGDFDELFEMQGSLRIVARFSAMMEETDGVDMGSWDNYKSKLNPEWKQDRIDQEKKAFDFFQEIKDTPNASLWTDDVGRLSVAMGNKGYYNSNNGYAIIHDRSITTVDRDLYEPTEDGLVKHTVFA